MLGALAGVDILLTDCTDVNSLNWNILPNFVHLHLDTLVECGQIFDGHSQCILYHRLNRHQGSEHFDRFYFN